MRYALFLRGVNVGTGNSLPMAALRSLLQRAGCRAVCTALQSGNAVFDTDEDAAGLTRRVEQALAGFMGRPIGTALRTEAQLARVIADNPFAHVANDPARLCVTFLARKPAAGPLRELLGRDYAPELIAAHGRELYSWHPNGQARSPLALALGKLATGGTVTTRNWNTVQRVRELMRTD